MKWEQNDFGLKVPGEGDYVAVLISNPKRWVKLEGVRGRQAAELRGSALLEGRVDVTVLADGERPAAVARHVAQHLRRMAQIQTERAASTAAEFDSPEAPASVNTSRRIQGMQLDTNGLRLKKSEAQALLAFTNPESASPFFGVHFNARKPTKKDDTASCLRARASTGDIAVDAFGHNLLGEKQEWFVNRAFLAAAVKLADAEHNILLKFSGASLHEASILDQGGNEVGSWTSIKDAANAQTSFPDNKEWTEKLKLPTREAGVRCLDLKIGCLNLLKKLGAAVGKEEIRIYPPPNDDERLIVAAEGEDTRWIALVDPATADTDED